MIEQALRTVCESRHRWLIVTAGTFVVGLVLVIPLVDVYSAEHQDKITLLAELESARGIASGLESFEVKVAKKITELEVLEARTVGEESLAALRNRLVDLARETGCSLRRLNVGAVSSRPWREGDDPISPRESNKRRESDTVFTLEWRTVSVSLSGALANLHQMLQLMEEDDMLMHMKNFEMRPANRGRSTLTLDMELWYFALTRGA